MDQTENNFGSLQNQYNTNERNFQHSSINNVRMSNMNNTNLDTLHINTMTPAPQNVTFEFYFPLPNDTRIYHVTYTELHPLENARLLNNRINLSHIPDHNIQSSIQQQIQQQLQQPVVYHQNSIQQQSFDTMSTQSNSQVYMDNNTYNTSTNGTIPGNMQDMGFQNFP
ncbi:hypothetical protein C1645_828508 [Glomus cerebriforme]|uniref:Uncharacterized protein n=1 Tax=Glomus cerebriforme TaxID=658196 RepID=A0A397SVN5_9GLOM|nr:hypothetical protein C1645_828508 [Glomus cerebriforme]